MISTLKAAFVQGMLAKDEFDLRLGQTLASRTYADLAAVTADLPAGLADAVPLRRAARRPMSNAARAGIWVVIAVAVPVVLSVPTGSPKLFLLCTPFYFLALAFLGAEMAAARQKQRSHRGQLPPSMSDAASPQPPSAAPGRQLPPGLRGHRHTKTARGRLTRRPLPVRGHCAGGPLAAGTAPTSG